MAWASWKRRGLVVGWRGLWWKGKISTRKTKIAGKVDREVSTRGGEGEVSIQSLLPYCHKLSQRSNHKLSVGS
jgi:hypothetical protein